MLLDAGGCRQHADPTHCGANCDVSFQLELGDNGMTMERCGAVEVIVVGQKRPGRSLAEPAPRTIIGVHFSHTTYCSHPDSEALLGSN